MVCERLSSSAEQDVLHWRRCSVGKQASQEKGKNVRPKLEKPPTTALAGKWMAGTTSNLQADPLENCVPWQRYLVFLSAFSLVITA